MSDVPPELFWEILTRVPVEPLLRFRCVCKAWRNIIDETEFIKSHAIRQNESNQLIIRNREGTILHTVSLDSLYSSETSTKTILAPRFKTITRRSDFSLPQFPVSSCSGLILIPHWNDERVLWVLWNHFTGEFRKLPLRIPSEGDNILSCGLGYDSVSDDYKVVRLAPLLNGRTSETLVYSLKSNSWRRIMDFPGMVHKPRYPVGSGCFWNGALHWMSCKQKEEMRIIALDLGTENYRVMSLPSALRAPNLHLDAHLYLDVLSGSLFISCCYSGSSVEIWITNEYGQNYSWIKLFSFAQQYGADYIILVRPIAYLKSKGLVLIQQNDKEFFWFDVEQKTAKRVEICGAPSYFSSQVFPASLFRLNSNGGADGGFVAKGTTKSKRKRPDDRLKLTLTFSDF